MPGSPPSAPARRNDALDGLRGVAALSVFVFHAWLYSRAEVRSAGAEGFLDQAVGELRIGLVLFFVLSGFLLFRPWVAARLGGDPARAPRLGTYAVHRLGRIVPAYYLAIAGSALLLWPLAGEPGVRLPPIEGLPLFFLFAQNQSAATVMTLDAPMWTLAVEASFYALLPALGWLALRARPTRVGQALVPLALVAVGVAFNAWLAQRSVPALTLSKSLPAMAPYFGVGMLAAVLIHGRVPGRRAASLLLGGGALLVLADGWVHGGLRAGSDLALQMRVVRDLPAAIGFGAIVAVAAIAAPRALAWRPLAAAGVISYGFYLWHVPLLLALRAGGVLPSTTLGATLVALGPALLAGWLSFRFVERPAIAWSRRTRVLGANDEPRRASQVSAPVRSAPGVSAPARPSARTAPGRTPTTAPASR